MLYFYTNKCGGLDGTTIEARFVVLLDSCPQNHFCGSEFKRNTSQQAGALSGVMNQPDFHNKSSVWPNQIDDRLHNRFMGRHFFNFCTWALG